MLKQLDDDQVRLEEQSRLSRECEPDPELPLCQFELDWLRGDVEAAMQWIYKNLMADEPYGQGSCELQTDLDSTMHEHRHGLHGTGRFESWISKKIASEAMQ